MYPQILKRTINNIGVQALAKTRCAFEMHTQALRCSARLRLLLLAATVAVAACTTLPAERFVQLGTTKIAWIKIGTSSPTVVLQSGLGDGMSAWAAVIDRLAGTVSTFAYDRPGYGSSGAVLDELRSPCVIARELRESLRAAGIAPPYLLVGHSIGGQYQLAFARLFPTEVVGMLLLDPTHPSHWSAMQEKAPAAATAIKALRSVVFSSAMRAEFDGQSTCLEATAALPTRIPTRILVRTNFELGETPAFRSMVRGLEQDWLSLIPGATRVPVDNAGHYIQKDQPAVVAAHIASMHRELQQVKP